MYGKCLYLESLLQTMYMYNGASSIKFAINLIYMCPATTLIHVVYDQMTLCQRKTIIS